MRRVVGTSPPWCWWEFVHSRCQRNNHTGLNTEGVASSKEAAFIHPDILSHLSMSCRARKGRKHLVHLHIGTASKVLEKQTLLRMNLYLFKTSACKLQIGWFIGWYHYLFLSTTVTEPDWTRWKQAWRDQSDMMRPITNSRWPFLCNSSSNWHLPARQQQNVKKKL